MYSLYFLTLPGTRCAAHVGHQRLRSRHAPPLATRLTAADNVPRDESPSGQGADRRPDALAPAASGVRPARVLPGRAGRLMRRDGPACRQVQILLGVYVLGGLRGQQETWGRTHLAPCGRCRAEYGEMAGA